MRQKAARILPCLFTAGAITTGLLAQDEPEDLGTFITEEVPIEENILPTSRPFNSVYGTERSILDTPRNVTIISREQLDAIAIKDVRDFSKLTSSSYTKTNFGSPSTPNLRGQEADLFVNGMRKGGSVNGNGLPINFNSVESVNIVKGPAGVVYGTTNYLGGYADLITKKPYFDGEHGSVGFSYGSYDQYTWNIDYSKPVSDKFAWRVSYEGKEWDGFWELWKHNSQALYVAATFKPTENYRIETYIEYFQADYTENWGINRVTQDLVDKGIYYPNAQTDAEYAAYVAKLGNGAGVFVPGLVAGVDYASVYGGAGYATIAVPDLNNPVPADRSWKLAAPGDDSFGKMVTAGIDQTWNLGEVEVVNKTYMSWKDRNTFSSYHYSELLKDNVSFDNRTEVRFKQEYSETSYLDVNTGVRFRYDDIWEVHHFNNEPVNFWDMTRDPETRRVPDQGFAGFSYVPGQEPHGNLSQWYFAEDTAGDTKAIYYGPFAQFDYKINKTFSLLAGYTIDFVDGKTVHPVLGESGSFDFDGDPNTPDTKGYKYEGDKSLENYNISLVYKVADNISTYVTYNLSETYPSETAGRLDVLGLEDDQESKLLEFGAKFSLLDGKFFLGTAYVDREYTTRNIDGTVDPVYLKLFEIEFNYQPNKNFFATMGYSHSDADVFASFYASPYTIDRANETGGLYISPTFEAPSRLLKAAGVPEHLVNGLFSYKWDNGFGMSLGFLGWGKMNSGYGGYEITIPNVVDDTGDYTIIANTSELGFQYEADLTLSYKHDDWAYKLTLYNITDEDNWDVNNSGYGNGSILARQPLRYELSAKYSF